ncbi:MAG TPA: hypothetical protein VNH17_23460 [Streptosporangiaceae bacterium]|nr:hypothetical protein [Streptosporangiaceae bacterium]
MKWASGRAWLAAVGAAVCAVLAVWAALAALLPGVAAAGGYHGGTPPARAAVTSAAVTTRAAAPTRHVVIVGISGLTWNLVTPSTTPALWRLAGAGSVGSLVDYAQRPVACPADGWLTLNSAARAQGPRPCDALPTVVGAGGGARVPALPAIIRANEPYHESPAWGLLGTLATCATAVGPGAALALAAPSGAVASYLPSAADLSPSVLARCPLTVVDLGQIEATERVRASAIDRQLARLAAELPAGTLLLVTAPGAAAGQSAGSAPAGPPHLMSVVVSGPGFASGQLDSAATRRPGIVTLTDLTPTVAGWLGSAVPAGTVGARITRSDRGDLDATVAGLRARDTAEQVWIATHGWFFIGYGIAVALAFGVPAALFWGAEPRPRERRARCWRAAGTVAAAVPLASFLANNFRWWELDGPAWWLYGLTAAGTLVLATAALLRGPWRRDPVGPMGVLCAATLLVLAVDVMTGSRLQLDAPYGLSLLVSGRYYGIGNDALGVYCVSALVAAGWIAGLVRRPALAAALVGLLAVVASGWPGFGAKAGGTIALVPCLVLLVAWLAGFRLGGRMAVPVAFSGLALFLVFAAISFLLPAAGISDMGAFAADLLHGRAGDVLQRKAGSNVGSITTSTLGWLIPVVAVASAAALWRPAAMRLRTLACAFEARPLLRILGWLCWLVLVIGWFADDSGVIVPAAALPFVIPLTIGMASSVSVAAGGAGYFGSALAGPSVAGSTPRFDHPQR